MNNFMTPLIVFAACSMLIFCYAVLCLLKIKKLEREEKADITNFCVCLKYNKDSLCYFTACYGVIPAAGMVTLYRMVESIVGDVVAITAVVAIAAVVGAIFYLHIESVRQKLIIRENQITYVSFFGIKKVFDFESIEKVEFLSLRGIRGLFHLFPKMIFTVQRPDSKNNYNVKFECVGFEYNNMDLLMERLQNVGLIGADEITNKTAVHENNQYSENEKFVVSCESDWVIYVLLLMLLFGLYRVFEAPLLGKDFFVAVSSVLFFVFLLFQRRVFAKVIYNNNVIEYGFIFKKKFKVQDVSHVKYIPHMNLVSAAKIFLKDEKSTFTVFMESKNFDEFFETLGREGVAFR